MIDIGFCSRVRDNKCISRTSHKVHSPLTLRVFEHPYMCFWVCDHYALHPLLFWYVILIFFRKQTLKKIIEKSIYLHWRFFTFATAIFGCKKRLKKWKQIVVVYHEVIKKQEAERHREAEVKVEVERGKIGLLKYRLAWLPAINTALVYIIYVYT